MNKLLKECTCEEVDCQRCPFRYKRFRFLCFSIKRDENMEEGFKKHKKKKFNQKDYELLTHQLEQESVTLNEEQIKNYYNNPNPSTPYR